MSNNRGNDLRSGTIPGLAILGLMTTGVLGLVHAFVTGDGTSLLASAVAFGVVGYVSFK